MNLLKRDTEVGNDDDILTEITLDEFMFQVRTNLHDSGSCILCVKSINSRDDYRVLGTFKSYDKKKVLDFIIKYSSDEQLRLEVKERRFAKRLESLQLNDFCKIDVCCEKEGAFINLFDLDCTVKKEELTKRRRQMAKKFHPDQGGNNLAMSVINEAYNYLLNNIYG